MPIWQSRERGLKSRPDQVCLYGRAGSDQFCDGGDNQVGNAMGQYHNNLEVVLGGNSSLRRRPGVPIWQSQLQR